MDPRQSSHHQPSKHVSPARAGMDPDPERDRIVVSPARAGMDPEDSRFSHMFPPHARGWTPQADLGVERSRSLVSPARAGMDPLAKAMAYPARICFPRTRGDGPGVLRLTDSGASCFPRTRGDGPGLAPCGYEPRPRGFPRTRGDGPPCSRYKSQMRPIEFPPHARGWTRRYQSEVTPEVDLDVVSPARAGMDPCQRIDTSSWLGPVSPARAGMDP